MHALYNVAAFMQPTTTTTPPITMATATTAAEIMI